LDETYASAIGPKVEPAGGVVDVAVGVGVGVGVAVGVGVGVPAGVGVGVSVGVGVAVGVGVGVASDVSITSFGGFAGTSLDAKIAESVPPLLIANETIPSLEIVDVGSDRSRY
jgi:hypothetical protein